MSHIDIPTLLFWENGNSWYGSLGAARFFIRPETTEELPPQLSVQFWCGPLEMSQSEILSRATFPITEEGLVQTALWLEEAAQNLPPQS